MKIWDKIKSNYNRPLVRTVLVVTGACVAGSVAGPIGVAAVVGGAFAYGVGTEYFARKNKNIKEISQKNSGRPLTQKQKNMAYGKALVDTLGIGTMISVAIPTVEDLNTAKAKTQAKVNKNKTKEITPAVPPVKISTRAFDFDFMKSQNQGGRKF